jgi:cytochrome bd-type quinol oxidase subunit 2
MLYDLVGYLGLALNLFSMYSKGESKLRIFSAIANFIYIIYGILIAAFPIIIGSSIAVLLHLYRLNETTKVNQKEQKLV